MEPKVIMPVTLKGHVAKHCNNMVNSLDENKNIVGVYSYIVSVVILYQWIILILFKHTLYFIEGWKI